MNNRFFFVWALFWSFPLRANIARFAQEFIQNNTQIVAAKNRVAVSKKDRELLKAQKNWSLNYQPLYNKKRLATISPFSPKASTNTAHNFSLIKNFEWGGQLTLTKSINNTQQSGNRHIPTLDTYLFTQGISYVQNLGADLFGRVFSKDLDIALGRYKMAQIQARLAIQKGLLKLSLAYSNVKLKKSFLNLQKEAKSRAQTRLNLVRRRVQDGLRENIDLYRAQSALFHQEEQLQSAEKELDGSLQQLEAMLHRKIHKSEIQKTSPLQSFPVKPAKMAHSEWLLSVQEERLSHHRLEKIGYQFFPKISLTASYQTNGIHEEFSKVVIEGSLLERNHDSSRIALNFSWPIGNGPQRIQRFQARTEQLLHQAKKKKLAQNLLLEAKHLKKGLLLLEKNIQSAKERKTLARKILGELNQLYRKGKAELDQVIRAEEDLINTEKSFIQYAGQKEALFCKLSYNYGTLDRYLLGEVRP